MGATIPMVGGAFSEEGAGSAGGDRLSSDGGGGKGASCDDGRDGIDISSTFSSSEFVVPFLSSGLMSIDGGSGRLGR